MRLEEDTKEEAQEEAEAAASRPPLEEAAPRPLEHSLLPLLLHPLKTPKIQTQKQELEED